MRHTKTCIRAAGKLFAVLVSIIATVTSARTASAAPSALPPAPDVLSVESSMRHDPEAIACLKKACSAGLPDDLFVVEVGKCRSAHLARVQQTFLSKPGDTLESVPYSTTVDKGPFTCEAMAGKPDPVLVAKVVELETQKVALIDEATQNPPTPPVVVATAAKSDEKKPTKPAVTSAHSEGDGVSWVEPARAPSQVPAATVKTVSWGSNSCLPDTFRLISMDADEAVVYVDAGGDYWSLAHSCLAKTYDTDPREIIKANSVERTIPYCDAGGKRTFDPARYADVLSGKKKLVWGDPANIAFLDDCEKTGGTVGVALQGRQRLTLIALAKTNPGKAAEGSKKEKHTSITPVPQRPGVTPPANEETEKLGSSVPREDSWVIWPLDWNPRADEGKIRYAVLTPSKTHPAETTSSIGPDLDPELAIQAAQTTWPPPRPPPQA